MSTSNPNRNRRADANDLNPVKTLRSPSSSSDIMSSSGRSMAAGGVPVAHPKPAYIAQGAAENLTSTELDMPVAVSDPALELLNSFLDQLLYNLLAISKSSDLGALRTAVPKLLKPRLGQAAMNAADEELRDYLEDEDMEPYQQVRKSQPTSDFDSELAWKLARLRCMVYARLGNMEEEDEEEFLESENLQELADTSSMATVPTAAIFLTSVLEFIGEQALCNAAQHAEKRFNTRLAYLDSPTKQAAPIDGNLTLETSDMLQLGREGPLSRLWRAWRRDTRLIEPSTSPRSNTPGNLMSPTWTDPSHSRKNSHANRDVIPEEDSPKGDLTPAQVPLPMRDTDIDEIEVPGLAPVIDGEEGDNKWTSAGRRPKRPKSMLMMPGYFPDSFQSIRPADIEQPEAGFSRPQPFRTRSQSLPTPPQGLLVHSQPSGARHTAIFSPQNGPKVEGEAARDEVAPSSAKERNLSPTPQADTQSSVRNNAISGTVAAIASALGVEAVRASRKGARPNISASPVYDERPTKKRTVAEEIMGTSTPVARPRDAEIGASITNVTDFTEPQFPTDVSPPRSSHQLMERNASDPEDLALSSGDEGNAAQSTEPRPRDSGFGVAEAARPDTSRDPPSSPRSNREAAVFENSIISSPIEPQGSWDREDKSERPDTADTGISKVSPLRDEELVDATSWPAPPESYRTATARYRPHQDKIQQPSASFPAAAPVAHPVRRSSKDYPQRAIHSPASSRSSQYSHHSQHSSSSSKLLGFTRDQNGKPQTLAQQRAQFHDGAPTPSNHSRSGSSAKDQRVLPHSNFNPTNVRPRRDHLRVRTSSEEDEAKTKSLEILIRSDETLHYTLTPESARAEKFPDTPLHNRTQTQELADFLRNTAPPGDNMARPRSESTRSNKPTNGLRANPPESQPGHPSNQQGGSSTAAMTSTAASQQSQPSNPKHLSIGQPRDPRPERNTTRDLADYVRSTGPVREQQLPQPLGSMALRPGTESSRAEVGGLAPNGVPRAPVGKPSTEAVRPATDSSTKSANRLKYQARDARPTRDSESTDLIDFIRQGPPRTGGEHRIDRKVAPFRTTMDSDDLQALAPPPDVNGRSSAGSYQGSAATATSIQASTNSRTGLLEAAHKPATTRVSGAGGRNDVARQIIPEQEGMPPRKRTKPRDPYAIDISDDELEEEYGRPPHKSTNDESLIDFLRNTAPPPGMTTQPILTTQRPMRQQGADVKRSASNSRLRDILTREGSNSGRAAPQTFHKSSTNGAREKSPHLTQVGSKADQYKPTSPTHAPHVERSRLQKSKMEARAGNNTGVSSTSDLADFLKNSGPPESGQGGKFGKLAGVEEPVYATRGMKTENVKEQAGFMKFFSRKGSVRAGGR